MRKRTWRSFEKLMAFDEEGLERRALVQNQLKPKEIAMRVTLANPWEFFSHSIKDGDPLRDGYGDQRRIQAG